MTLELLRHTLNGPGAEFCVFFPDLAGLFIFRGAVPGLNFFQALPLLKGDALGRWCAVKRGHFLPHGEEAPAVRFDYRLRLWRVLFSVCIEVCDFDFRNVVDGRLRLGMKPLNRNGANCDTREQCQDCHGPSFHVISSLADKSARKDTTFVTNGGQSFGFNILVASANGMAPSRFSPAKAR